MPRLTEQFPAQPRTARKAPLVVSDPQAHRAQHTHSWVARGGVRQCQQCWTTEVDGE